MKEVDVGRFYIEGGSVGTSMLGGLMVHVYNIDVCSSLCQFIFALHHKVRTAALGVK